MAEVEELDFPDDDPEPLRALCPTPHDPKPGLILRPYQVECSDRVYESLQSCRSTLAVLATGLGKTVIFADVCDRWPLENGRVLVLAHRDELITQAKDKLAEYMSEVPGVERNIESEARAGHSLLDRSKVLVASVQTMCRINRLKPFDPFDFGLVICDEAHHATSESYKTIFGYFQQNPQLRMLGVTATPDRADGEKLGQIYESVAFEMDVLEGIENGWLVPIQQKCVTIQELDFSWCKTTAGDINQGDLERSMIGASDEELGNDSEPLTEEQIEARKKQERMLHAVAAPAIQEANGRPGIMFCVTIDHAEKMAEVMRRYPGVTAETVTQGTSREVRADHVAAFKAGRLQWLVGVGVFTEGFDAPNAAVIAVARPTKSRSLYCQMVGRATRPDINAIRGIEDAEAREAGIAASGKPNCTVLDFVGNSGRHKLITTADILGDKYPEDLREAVLKMLAATGEAQDIQEALAAEQARRDQMKALEEARKAAAKEAAERRLAELRAREEEEAKLRRLRAEAKYKARDVDPFGHRADYHPPTSEFRGGASQKQVDFLVALGVKYETALGYGSRQAHAVIDSLRERTGGEFRVTFGKSKGKSLKEAGNGFIWWVKNHMTEDERGRRAEILRNIEIMEAEKTVAVATVESSEVPF